jgi:hypothetical protein
MGSNMSIRNDLIFATKASGISDLSENLLASTKEKYDSESDGEDSSSRY